MKLDLGCGSHKRPGFTGVDISAECGADIVHDLAQTPWPFADGSVDEVWCSNFFEHLTGAQRLPFMDELWRVLRVGATATMITPYWTCGRAIQDPTHQWPPISEASYLYFNRAWREREGLTHYGIRCDFDFRYSFSLTPQWQGKPEAEIKRALLTYFNVASDINVFLTKRA
jgi:hypothetical protein